MKKLTFITALVFISGSAIGQNLIEANKLWTSVECIGYCWTWGHQFEGDTIINGTPYNKLWQTTDSTFTNWYYARAMRETPDGKVYQLGSDGEELLYDFSLEVNEHFITEINGCEINLEVESIDSITLLNGERRKRINFVYEIESWIEGIGSTYGLLNVGWEQCAVDWYFELNCFTENDTLKYDNPDFEGCYVITTGAQESATGSLQLSPNPFRDFTKFTFPYNENNTYKLQIIDVQGKIIKTITNIHLGELIIQDQNLQSGLYYLVFYENGQLRNSEKMIKQ